MSKQPAPAPTEIETVTAARCPECETIRDPTELVRVYECSSCGEFTEERRCPECNKFTARADFDGCPDCLCETDEFEAVRDVDGDLVDPDDYDPDVKVPVKERKRLDAEAAKKARSAKTDADFAALQASSTESTWGALVPGDRIITGEVTERDKAVTVGRPHLVLDVTECRDGRVVVVTEQYGPTVHVHASGDPVLVVPPNSERDACNPLHAFGKWSVSEQTLRGSSSPHETVTVTLHKAAAGEHRMVEGMPVLSLDLRSYNWGARVASFVTAAHAETGLDALDDAADRLAAQLGVTLTPADPNGPGVIHGKPEDWFSVNLTEAATVRIGSDSWHKRHKALIAVQAGSHTVSMSDPQAVRDAVAAARELLPSLIDRA